MGIPGFSLIGTTPTLASSKRVEHDADSWGIAAVEAHTSPWTGDGVAVAILDTGIDNQHQAFAGTQIVELVL
jgi:hypothetical protein